MTFTNRMKKNLSVASMAGTLLLSRHVSAASVNAAPDNLDPTVGLSELIGLGGSLLLVIGTVLVVGWIYARSQGVRGSGSDVFSIVAAQPLGPKERIMLVEIGGKQIVLGMTSTQVQTLHVFDEPVVSVAAKPAVTTPFADRLRALRGVAR